MSTMTHEAVLGEAQLDVLVLDDEQAFAERLAMALTSRSFGTWQVRAATPAEVLRQVPGPATSPKAVVMSGSGARQRQLVTHLSQRHPSTAVVVLLGAGEEQSELPPLVRAGARGWVSTDDSLDHLSHVLREVTAGEWWLPRWAVGDALQELRRSAEAGVAACFDSLTPRERQILTGLVHGQSKAAIAREYDMSVNTVRTHVQHLFEKLGVHSCLEAVLLTQGREDLLTGDMGAPVLTGR